MKNLLYKTFIYFLKLATYGVCLAVSLSMAYCLRYNFIIPQELQKIMWCNIIFFVPLKILVLVLLGEFKGIFSYFRLNDLVKIVSCFMMVSFVCLLISCFYNSIYLPSRSILLADLLFSILFILFFRTSLRIINSHINNEQPTQKHFTNIAVIGTNEVASRIISELKLHHYHGLNPVAIFDDNPKYFGRLLHDIPVAGVPEMILDLAEQFQLQGVLVASEYLSQKRMLQIADLAKKLNLKMFTIPSLNDFIDGRATATRLRPLDVEDFLERKTIRLDLAKTQELIAGKTILITGAGGSIGSELTKQIARKNPRQLILVEHSEYNLFKIEQNLLREGFSCVPVLLNITHTDALKDCFERYRPEIVYHAAAYKHVPLLESQPIVALNNNVYGTGSLALLASQYGVERFVLVSTDKAIDPVNYMGASKRLCEMFCMAIQHFPENKTQFMAVRFGNVLGSVGSVLPTFKEQIARGGPLTVTHPDMTRFFMTIPEAVGLILEASSFEKIAGKIFVLYMGNPVKILDVAKKMIELNGYRVGVDIDIVFTGIRPGEKLHEDLTYDQNKVVKTNNAFIGIFNEKQDYTQNIRNLDSILKAIKSLKTVNDCKDFIKTFIPDFKHET